MANSLSRFDPYGNFNTTPATNPTTSNQGHTGHRHNNTGPYDLGLIYMNDRYYVPEVGRFVSPDTIVPDPGNPQSFNRYSYVNNSPVNYIDPTGHFPSGSLVGDAPLGDNEPEGDLYIFGQPVEGCDPVFQSCGSEWWVVNAQLLGACADGKCLQEHLWVYFGIPHTAQQRAELVKDERRGECPKLCVNPRSS